MLRGGRKAKPENSNLKVIMVNPAPKVNGDSREDAPGALYQEGAEEVHILSQLPDLKRKADSPQFQTNAEASASAKKGLGRKKDVPADPEREAKVCGDCTRK